MENELFHRTGLMALGSRLRMFTDLITCDAAKIYDLFGLNIQPKWFPVLFILIDGVSLPIGAIAKQIGHSHPSVVKIVREMQNAGIVEVKASATDKRSTDVRLSAKGMEMVPTLFRLCSDVQTALEGVCGECGVDLWETLRAWENALGEKSLVERVSEAKIEEEQSQVRIVSYVDALHREAFYTLNERWISELFVVESADLAEMANPQQSIIDKGGYIFMAELDGKPVGTFAMMRRHDKYDWELVKFTVATEARGHGVGMKLMQACLNRAKMLGGHNLFLETNHKCEAAIHIYHKAGFYDIPIEHTDYARADVQMEMKLE